MRYLTFSMLDHLILFQKIYDFIRWLYPTINKFPKNQRFVLGQQLEQSAISILKLTIRAEQTRGAERLEYQRHLSVELDVLRILCRLSKDLRFVSIGQYAFTAERINEMGRILGGWQKVNGGGGALNGFYVVVNKGGALKKFCAFIRGGNWDNGANAGAFTLNLNNAPENSNTNIGFRCASDLSILGR